MIDPTATSTAVSDGLLTREAAGKDLGREDFLKLLVAQLKHLHLMTEISVHQLKQLELRTSSE